MIDPRDTAGSGGNCRLEFLGGFRVLTRRGLAARFRTQKAASLLAYLACFKEQRHSRDFLAELFWPEDDLDRGRASLRTALSSLRQVLADGSDVPLPLESGRTYVTLDPTRVVTDVGEFEAWIQMAAHEPRPDYREHALLAAVEIYRGPLLPGLCEEWAEALRERLAERFLSAVQELSSQLSGRGQWEDAIRLARRVVSADPLSAEARLLLIRLLVDGGQDLEARAEWERFRRFCAERLDQPPSPVIEARILQLLTRTAAPVPQSGTSPGLASPWREDRRVSNGSKARCYQGSGCIGREQELAELSRLLSDPGVRLITVTGTGGVGKTRLVQELRPTVSATFPEGTYFLPLAEVPPADPLAERILHRMGVDGEIATNLVPYLRQRFAGRRALFLLDSVEHLAPAAALLLSQLTAEVPGLTLLVTSQFRLYLEGEHELALAPLAVPESDTPEAVARSASGQLFLSRARTHDPDLCCDERTAVAVATVCRRLEGLPLALELAAARAGILAPAEIARALERSLDILSTARPDVSPRHRTLRATIEWSLALLTPDQQALFTALSVFRGAWTTAAAQAICSESPAEETAEQIRLLDGLQLLRDTSLLVFDLPGTKRLRMLEPLQRFASQRLGAARRVVLVRRHLAYFAQRAEELRSQLRGPAEPAALTELELDLDNFRAALEHSLQIQEDHSLIRLVLAAWPLLQCRGLLGEAERWVAAGLAAAERLPAAPEERALLWTASAELELDRFRWNEARVSLRRAQEHAAGQYDDLPARIGNLLGLAWIGERNYPEARAVLHRTLVNYEASRDLLGIAIVCNNLGRLEDEDPQGDRRLGKMQLERSLELFRSLGYLRGCAEVVNNLGALAQEEARLDEAWDYYQEALTHEIELRRPLGLARVLCNLGEVAEARHEPERSLRLFRSSEQLFASSGAPHAEYARSAAARVATGRLSGLRPPAGCSTLELLAWAGCKG